MAQKYLDQSFIIEFIEESYITISNLGQYCLGALLIHLNAEKVTHYQAYSPLIQPLMKSVYNRHSPITGEIVGQRSQVPYLIL